MNPRSALRISALMLIAALAIPGQTSAAQPTPTRGSRPGTPPTPWSGWSWWSRGWPHPHPGATPVQGALLAARHAPSTIPTITVGVNPVGVAVDAATHTMYVASAGGVSVVNTAHCNAQDTSGCSQTPITVTLGSNVYPLSVLLVPQTHTVYVTNPNANTVSMINAATCNAIVTTSCGQTPPTVTVGTGPNLLDVDRATDTIYVANGGAQTPANTVSVINGATCNAADTSGCGQTAAVTVGSSPNGIAVDQDSGMVYVANFNDGTVSVVDGTTCNATVTTGCGQTPPTIAVGTMPNAAIYDAATHTIYVVTFPLPGAASSRGLVAMFNGAVCSHATWPAGCVQPPLMATVGSGPIWVDLNQATQTVYVGNQEDSTVSVLDDRTCNATTTAGCPPAPPALATGFNVGGLAVDPSTDTLYVTSQNNNTVSVLDGGRCNAVVTAGCTRFAPTTAVGLAPQGIAVNAATHTVYVANRNDPNNFAGTLSVIDASVCNAAHPAGCTRAWPIIAVGHFAQNLAVDQATDTVYVVNAQDNTVSVINGATCNATITSGCNQAAPTVALGAGTAPFALAVNEATDTIYVANNGNGTVSVINGATCNGTVTSGCGQTPPTVTVGACPDWVAIAPATDTAYVANACANTVSVVDGATCNGTVTSGCTQTPPTVSVGQNPIGLAVDEASGTVYVANCACFVPQYAPVGTVSLIDGTTCNGTVTTGCGQTPPSVAVGGYPFGLAVDQATETVYVTSYVTSIVDSDVAVLDGHACTATHPQGCHPQVVPQRMGGWPGSIALDDGFGTAYVPDNVDSAVSFFGLRG